MPTQTAAVRPASRADAEAVADAVGQLLAELGALDFPPAPSLLTATRELLDRPSDGLALVAEAEDTLVGILAASWLSAIHAPGRYALIQNLWVLPDWRGRGVGHQLIEELCRAAREQGIGRLEVGLPHKGFDQFDATEAFYLGAGFTYLGPRMKRRT